MSRVEAPDDHDGGAGEARRGGQRIQVGFTVQVARSGGRRRCSSPRSTCPAARCSRASASPMALPFLEAMVPARTAFAKTAAGKVRLAAIEMVHGSAGSTAFGMQKNMWAPAAVGRDFDLSPTSLAPLEPLPRPHHHRQQHRRAQRRGVRAAGNRRRPLPLERGVPDADASEADAGLGRARRHVARPVLRAAASARTRRSRRCSCASRTSTRPAAAPTATRASTPTRSAGRRPTEPLPMIRDPRMVFDQLFGVGATPQSAAERRAEDKSILDWITPRVAQLNKRPRRRRSRAPRRLPR